MTAFRTFGLLCGGLASSLLGARDLSTYRGFQFGMDVSMAAKQAGQKASEVRVVHLRPALIQELEWRPTDFGRSVDIDPIKNGLLSFYKNELFRIVITYDRYRVEGMTADDMIDGISTGYGTATKPRTEVAYHSNYGEVAAVLARWEDSEYSYNLVRTGDGGSFALVMYSKRLDALAAAAIREAVRLDATELPQREIAAEQKRQEGYRLSLEKARSINAPNFRP